MTAAPFYTRQGADLKLTVIHQPATEPWYADGLRFACTQCGNCCTGGPGFVWISDEEVARLADHLDLTEQQVIDRYCRRIGSRTSLQEHRNSQGLYDCVFLREIPATRREGDREVSYSRRVCTIYDHRPLQCRTWPFWEGLLESRENWDRAAARCPGMNRGPIHTRERIESLRDARDWP